MTDAIERLDAQGGVPAALTAGEALVVVLSDHLDDAGEARKSGWHFG